MACFTNCHFDESILLTLKGEKEKQLLKEIMWNNLSYLDPCTRQCKLEVQKILHLQSIAKQLPDEFIDLKRITKSHIPVANVLLGQSINEINNKFRIGQKCGKSIDLKDKILAKGKEQLFKPIKEIHTLEEFKDITNKITSKEV